MDRPVLVCPICKAKVTLPSVAVRLTGYLMCPAFHTFAYPANKYYNRDGSLKQQKSK
jgi:hypothetical protein